ncbi:MAG: hypothetical protein L3J74_13425 [Bacteroidales bacterium]|nr:hypothetical protein [Bacteroidales bacterium]
MKYIMVLLVPFMMYATEQRMLLSGFTMHEHTYDRFGEKYNAVNYGVGYEYTFFEKYSDIYFATNVLLLNDSFENPQVTIGLGHYYRFDTGLVDTAIGLTGFFGIKKIYTDDDKGRGAGKYGLTGGFGPAVNFYYEDVSVNFVYVPGFKYKEIDTTGFLYLYFGYKF